MNTFLLIFLIIVGVIVVLYIIDKMTEKNTIGSSSGGLASKLKGVVSACCNKIAGKNHGI